MRGTKARLIKTLVHLRLQLAQTRYVAGAGWTLRGYNTCIGRRAVKAVKRTNPSCRQLRREIDAACKE